MIYSNEGQSPDPAYVANALRSERDEMLQFLMQANLRLQEYEQEKNNFLARSVHDLCSPLTAFSGYCELLLEGSFGPVTQQQREVLARMQRSATRLSRISNAIFHLTLPHSVGERTLDLEQGDIRECVYQALEEVSPVVDKKRITVSVDIDSPPENLLFEKSQIRHAVVNLLDNACKFTPREGSISIKGYSFFWERRTGRPSPVGEMRDRRTRQLTIPNSFRVDIQDSGPGISPEDVDDIFKEYSYSGGQDRSGSGLGLAICRMILDWHGGRIWAESRPSGAVFSFVVPLRPQNTNLTTGECTDRTDLDELGEV